MPRRRSSASPTTGSKRISSPRCPNWSPPSDPIAIGSEGGDQFGYRGEEIGFEPVVGDAEDRRLGILVDRDDHLRILHASEVLDGTADADGDVELRRDDLAGLTDLPIVRCIPRVDRGTARTERGPELVCEWREHLV